jgi:hypothetical protein
MGVSMMSMMVGMAGLLANRGNTWPTQHVHTLLSETDSRHTMQAPLASFHPLYQRFTHLKR